MIWGHLSKSHSGFLPWSSICVSVLVPFLHVWLPVNTRGISFVLGCLRTLPSIYTTSRHNSQKTLSTTATTRTPLGNPILPGGQGDRRMRNAGAGAGRGDRQVQQAAGGAEGRGMSERLGWVVEGGDFVTPYSSAGARRGPDHRSETQRKYGDTIERSTNSRTWY